MFLSPMVKDTWSYKGFEGTIEWRPDLTLEDVSVTKSHVIAFDGEGFFIISRPERDGYELPGGTKEDGETPIEALKREVWEEANIKIDNIELLGMEKITYKTTPHLERGRKEFRAKFIADVHEISSLTSDPDEGYHWERRIVEPSEDIFWLIDNYADDNQVRKAMLRHAHQARE